MTSRLLSARTPHGRVAVGVTAGGLLRVWDWAGLAVLAEADGPPGCAVVAIDPEGTRAATGHGCLAALWDLGRAGAGAAPAVLAGFGAERAVKALALAGPGWPAGGAGRIDLVAGDVGGTLHRLRLVSPGQRPRP